MSAENMTKRRGLVAILLVAVTVVMMVCYMAIEPAVTPMNGRKLSEEATGKENKMAFKAMKINAKYEIKSAMVTTLRGGSLQERHDTFAALKSNIYAGIKDMKHVVLLGLKDAGGKRRMESPEDRPAVSSAKAHAQKFNDEPWSWQSIVNEAGRKLPSVHIVKGAFKAMKGQMKSTFIAFKGPIKATSKTGATFQAKHDAIKDLKHQLKGAILINRGITSNDDHDDDAWLHAGTNNVNAAVSKAEIEAAAAAAAAAEAAQEKAMEKVETKFEAKQKSEIKADVKKITAEENLPTMAVSAVSNVVAVAAQKLGEVASTMENTLMGSSGKKSSSKSDKKSAKKSEKKSSKKSSKK